MLEKEKNRTVVGTAEDMANLDAELSLGKEEMAEKSASASICDTTIPCLPSSSLL